MPIVSRLADPGVDTAAAAGSGLSWNLLIEDENRTIDRLRRGEAFGAITT